jgi:hypothetical protein
MFRAPKHIRRAVRALTKYGSPRDRVPPLIAYNGKTLRVLPRETDLQSGPTMRLMLGSSGMGKTLMGRLIVVSFYWWLCCQWMLILFLSLAIDRYFVLLSVNHISCFGLLLGGARANRRRAPLVESSER